jgi:ABC-type multidrug transport system permease subunit
MKTQARRLYGYLKKDTMLLYKRKKYLYLFILLPLIIGGLFLFALNTKDYNIKVGICDLDDTDLSQKAYANLNEFVPVILQDENCIENVQAKIKYGELDMGLIIPNGFEHNIENLKQTIFTIYYDNTDIAFSNLVSWKVDQALVPFKRQVINNLNTQLSQRVSTVRDGVDIILSIPKIPGFAENKVEEADSQLKTIEEMETSFLTNPVWTNKVPVYEASLNKDAGITYIFPILTIFIVLMLASTSIIYDKNTNFLTRVKASASPISYLVAKTIFFTCLVLIQFLIILGLFMISGARYALPPTGIIQLILFVGIIDTLIGFIIGRITNNEGIAVLFSLMISFPLMLVSGIFFPTQALPKIIQWIGKILPLQQQINASKAVLLFGQKISNTWIWFAAVLFIIVVWLIRKE